MIPRAEVAPAFVELWARFCRDMIVARDRFDIATAAVYKPDAGGRGSVVVTTGDARTSEQAFKVLWFLRRKGWAVKIIRGKQPTITVDLRIEPLEDE